jgi:hypothetical protein
MKYLGCITLRHSIALKKIPDLPSRPLLTSLLSILTLESDWQQVPASNRSNPLNCSKSASYKSP